MIKRIYAILGSAALLVMLSACSSNQSDYVFSTTTSSSSDYTTTSASSDNTAQVPWDYRVLEGQVGDLIGSDMTLLPDNVLLPNDNNYATGDKVWVLQFMDAELTTDAAKRNQIKLSSWTTLKSYTDNKSAEADLTHLKEFVQSEVDLVGVYKTENQGKTRQFAVVTLPSGNAIKQPISEERYAKLKQQTKVKVNLELVHDFENYDTVYSKFRGWSE